MLTVQELYNRTSKPIINQIDFKLLQEYYETYLMPARYIFDLEDGSEIDLWFKKKRFCHLLGIESTAKFKYRNPEKLKQYKGEWGYKRIKNGQLTFESFKNEVGKNFNRNKDKLVNFYLVPHIFNSPELVIRYKKTARSRTECEFLIYDYMHNVCASIGVEKDPDDGTYYPRTFLVDKEDNPKFLEDQDKPIGVKRATVKPSELGTPITPVQTTIIVPRPTEETL